MSTRALRLDLTRPMLGGVYSVDQSILNRLAAEAERSELAICRVSLAGCHNKAKLLQAMAAALSCPPDFGDNWDALADSLRDLSWLPQWGHVLLLDNVDELQQTAPEDFAILLGIFDDAATFAVDRDQPFFAFLGHTPPADPAAGN